MQLKLKEVHWFNTFLFLLNFLSTLLHHDLLDFFFFEKNFFFLKMWFLRHAIPSSGGQQQSLFSTMFCPSPVLHDVQHRDTMFWGVPTQVNGVSLDIYSCFGQWNLTGHLVTGFSYQKNIHNSLFSFLFLSVESHQRLHSGQWNLTGQTCFFWLWRFTRQTYWFGLWCSFNKRACFGCEVRVDKLITVWVNKLDT